MRRFVGLFLLLLAAAPAHAADRKFDADAAAKAVAPYLDDRTVAVVHVDLTRVDVDALFKQLVAAAGLKDADVAESKKATGETLQALLKAGAKDAFVVFSLIDLPMEPPFIVLPADKDADAKAILEVTPKPMKPSGGAPDYGFEQIGKAVVGGAEGTRKRLKTLKPEPRPEVAKAFAASGDGLARAVVFATTDTRKILEETMPNLPPELGGGSIKVLTRGLQWASLRIDAPPQMKLHWIYQASDKEAAKALRELMEKGVKAVCEIKEFRDAVPDGDKLLKALLPDVNDDRLTLTMDADTLVKLLAPAVMSTRAAAGRAQTTNNFKQIGLALHNYNDTTGRLPAVANFDKKDKPLLSWRVHILPYIEQDKLYKEFHLDEPWDSEHNKKLIPRMPKVYASLDNPKLAADGKTTVLAPVHMNAVFTGDKTGIRFADITDGTSNTVMLVDAADDAAVIWTKPDDLKIDLKDPAKGLSARHNDRYLFLFADGSVYFAPKNIDKATLSAIFTRNGGEPVRLP
jgi:hypothetical protein